MKPADSPIQATPSAHSDVAPGEAAVATHPRLLRRLVPAPLLSLALLGLWLLLNRSLSAGHIVLGTVLGVAIPLLTAGLRPLPVRVRKPGMVARVEFLEKNEQAREVLDIMRDNQHLAGVFLDMAGPDAQPVVWASQLSQTAEDYLGTVDAEREQRAKQRDAGMDFGM